MQLKYLFTEEATITVILGLKFLHTCTQAHTHAHFIVSLPSPRDCSSGHSDQLLEAAGGNDTNSHQPLASFLGRNRMLMVVVYSSSPQDPL